MNFPIKVQLSLMAED